MAIFKSNGVCSYVWDWQKTWPIAMLACQWPIMKLILSVSQSIQKCLVDLRQDWHGSALILLSSVLLGIWALKNTIALRNTLLYAGAILAVTYLIRLYRQGMMRSYFHRANAITLILLALMFIWVVLHYFFFSRYPQIQLHELKSTWLPAFLPSLIGTATAIAISKRVNYLPILFCGVLISFFSLLIQYLDRVKVSGSLFAPDVYGYIYFGKINAALMGSILLAASSGMLLDQMVRLKNSVTKNHWMPFILSFIFWLVSAAMILYLNIYAFDSRVGFGIAALIIIFTLLAFPIIWISEICSLKKGFRIKAIIGALFLSLAFGWAIFSQLSKQTGWRILLEDVQIAAQVEKYPHWQNLGVRNFEYPRANDGRMVQPNTYERVAWFVVGCKLALQNIYGIGVLNRPFPALLMEKYPDLTAPSTHSGWVEYVLAFGIPGVFLMTSLISSFLFKKNSTNYYFLWLVGGSLVLMYLIGELSAGHAVEILFYFVMFLSML
jgi:hypothetical protein